MVQIALICCDSYELNLNDWHHYGFWKKTLDAYEGIQLHWYNWNNWHLMPKNLDLYFFLDYRHNLWKLCNYRLHHYFAGCALHVTVHKNRSNR